MRVALLTAVLLPGGALAFASTPRYVLPRSRLHARGAPVARGAPTMTTNELKKAPQDKEDEQEATMSKLGVGKLWDYARGKSTTATVTCGEMGTDECVILCDDLDDCSMLGSVSMLRTMKLGLYFALWFGLSAGYNIANKRVLNSVALPWLHSTATLGVGCVYVLALWLSRLRPAPKLNGAALRTLVPIAMCHAVGHLSAVLSFSAGAVSFTQIVKAGEPVFTCGLSVLVLKQAVSLPVALSLLPIVLGVSLASVTELSFTWLAFGAAMMSNLAFASRNIFARLSLDAPKGENMTPENLYGVLTLMAFVFSVPFALLVEGGRAAATLQAATMPVNSLIRAVLVTGAYFYLYNEVAMLALNNVHPVTHAVANTIKRVVILLACLLVFRNPITPLCAVGSAIAIGGSYVYSMAKQRERAAS